MRVIYAIATIGLAAFLAGCACLSPPSGKSGLLAQSTVAPTTKPATDRGISDPVQQ